MKQKLGQNYPDLFVNLIERMSHYFDVFFINRFNIFDDKNLGYI